MQLDFNLRRLRSNEFLGAQEFFSGQSSQMSARVTTPHCQVFMIDRAQFIELLRGYPLEYQKFCQLQHQVRHNELTGVRSRLFNCGVCDKPNHRVLECRTVYYQPNKRRLIYHYKVFSRQFRSYQLRRIQFKNAHPWIWQPELAQLALELQQDEPLQLALSVMQNPPPNEPSQTRDGSNLEADLPELDSDVRKSRSLPPKPGSNQGSLILTNSCGGAPIGSAQDAVQQGGGSLISRNSASSQDAATLANASASLPALALANAN